MQTASINSIFPFVRLTNRHIEYPTKLTATIDAEQGVYIKYSNISENFVGVNMTETIVEHLRQHDVENKGCDLDISDVYEMLGELDE